MSDSPADSPQPQPAPAPAQRSPGRGKPGLFKRLFGIAPAEEDLVVAVAPFVDAAGQDLSRQVAEPFQGLKHVHLTFIKDAPTLTPDTHERNEHLPAAAAQAMGWLAQENADLVLWGDIPSPGTTLFVHFASPPPADTDPAATISPFQPLNLPVGFEPEPFGGLLLATGLAAMMLSQDAKRQHRRALVADALERANDAVENIPRDFTLREKSTVHAAYANALATFAHLIPGVEALNRASDAYVQALKGTLKGDSPTNWAYIQRNMGAVLQALGERTDDVAALEQSEQAYRHALEIFTREATPFPWATTLNRLGEVLYRLDIKSGETKRLKEALTIYQDAIKVMNRHASPMLWSETMNNFGQAAQVLGRELGNAEVVERAVSACQQALKARDRETHPTLWATTQNNLGSALFLLGRLTGEESHYHEALEAFMGAREMYNNLGLSRMVEITDKNIQHTQSRLPEGAAEADGAMWWLEEDDAGQKKK